MQIQFKDFKLERAYLGDAAVEAMNAWLEANPVAVVSIETIVHDRFDHVYRLWYRSPGDGVVLDPSDATRSANWQPTSGDVASAR
ncbi:hypothetical protein [Burkholderia cenocepacia]|uniref:hypothetical protein n=1 Tax=Burkholderia cenocepacia TaxID=95486 RepID=UPI002B240DB0|nr:hypothetical protein [Burkholderia cenocepacia]MEB2558752.1 hypothetical protein [Burkholderia cenocepacia]